MHIRVNGVLAIINTTNGHSYFNPPFLLLQLSIVFFLQKTHIDLISFLF